MMIHNFGLLLTLLGPTAAPAHGFAAPPPEAYLDPVDRQMARTHTSLPGRPGPCAREERQNGIAVIVSAPVDRCFRMLPPRRWRGLWRNDFEGSQFCPEPATRCDYGTEKEQIWLTERPDKRPDGKLYRIEFIGRKTMYKGAYGHMGASDHEIVMDRLIAAQEVAKPRAAGKPGRPAHRAR
jgi:hypothetical protein